MKYMKYSGIIKGDPKNIPVISSNCSLIGQSQNPRILPNILRFLGEYSLIILRICSVVWRKNTFQKITKNNHLTCIRNAVLCRSKKNKWIIIRNKCLSSLLPHFFTYEVGLN